MATETIPQPRDQLSKPPPPSPPAPLPDKRGPEPHLDPNKIEPERPEISPWPSPRPTTPPDILEKRKALKARMPTHKLKIEDFELLRTLGTGG